jgi:hypothetical protein
MYLPDTNSCSQKATSVHPSSWSAKQELVFICAVTWSKMASLISLFSSKETSDSLFSPHRFSQTWLAERSTPTARGCYIQQFRDQYERMLREQFHSCAQNDKLNTKGRGDFSMRSFSKMPQCFSPANSFRFLQNGHSVCWASHSPLYYTKKRALRLSSRTVTNARKSALWKCSIFHCFFAEAVDAMKCLKS